LAITSSPKLSALGDYVFRVTAPNTAGAELLIEHVRSKGFPKVAIIYEETEYAQGLGEFFRAEAEKAGISVTYYNSFSPGETDFRSMVTKLRGSGAEALYLSPQSPDGTIGILRALKEQNVSIPVLGNEIAGNTVKAAGGSATFFENMVFAEPEFNSNSTEVKTFEERYKKRFNVPALPYGFYTCEAYDAVRVIAHIIKTCGADADLAKRCLYELKDYKGLSGRIAFDKNGDGIRRYVLKKIVNGQILQ
jgi:branched-chain amino acid transport system substrate-binding protein